MLESPRGSSSPAPVSPPIEAHFLEVYRRFVPRLMRDLRRRGVGHLGGAVDEEDLCQDACLEFLRVQAGPRAEPPASVTAYLRRSALNRGVNAYRRRLIEGPHAALPEELPSRRDAPDEAVERLRAELRALALADRRICELHFFQELPLREVARRVGRSKSAVHRRLEAVFHHLRRRLGGENR